MKETVKIQNKQQVLMIAHRGVSGLETENTLPAFHAAGIRSYFGIETDVHCTADGKFIIFHDDSTGRVANRDIPVEKSRFDELRSLSLKDLSGNNGQQGLTMPSLSEYIEVCKKYGKKAILEIKNPFEKADIDRLCVTIKSLGWFENTVFISFYYENLARIKADNPNAQTQFLCKKISRFRLWRLSRRQMDLDILYTAVTPELIDLAHRHKIKVNCWTVNEPADANRLIEYGIDFITSNILE